LYSANGASSSGGIPVYLDYWDNIHVSGESSGNNWEVITAGNSAVFMVYNSTTASTGTKVATYNNTLDDG